LAGAVAGGLAFAPRFRRSPARCWPSSAIVPLAVGVGRAADDGGLARVAARLGVWFTVVGFGLALLLDCGSRYRCSPPLAFLAYIGHDSIGMSALVALTTDVGCSWRGA